MKLAYRTIGEGQPLVILHGLFGSGDNWLTISKVLSDRHQIFLVDQRNHGRSPHSDEWTYKAMADDLYAFLQEHNLQNPILIGHSMGGKTVMQFAITYPNVARKIVVVDIAPKLYPPHHQDVLAGLHAVDLANITSRNDAEAAMATAIKEADVRQFLLKNLYRNENGQFAWRVNLPLITQKIEEIGVTQTSPTPVQIPALFVRGALSKYIKDADLALIQNLFPNSELKTIEGAGHWVQAEKPAEFVQAVQPFLYE
ncbi:Pimeloyl-ACP methyl ester carboxylesterase [Flexibacter flexilis DSM 6793]|uniref:Pimeloyl-ACP methyl ester carboxylesterase n=1 Tax=Flexibacter flexilis DSM 6793 TaxID=927664 RepID=A0A1I1JYR7_9BACT|nr:alpha/beta fold hydrolase [Flexibacter flexilis]SFC50903.1 Pimeloyl-ACP methyl ester carboxylesterase [Flexibacter flexilis DSM 6793]